MLSLGKAHHAPQALMDGLFKLLPTWIQLDGEAAELLSGGMAEVKKLFKPLRLAPTVRASQQCVRQQWRRRAAGGGMATGCSTLNASLPPPPPPPTHPQGAPCLQVERMCPQKGCCFLAPDATHCPKCNAQATDPRTGRYKQQRTRSLAASIRLRFADRSVAAQMRWHAEERQTIEGRLTSIWGAAPCRGCGICIDMRHTPLACCCSGRLQRTHTTAAPTRLHL